MRGIHVLRAVEIAGEETMLRRHWLVVLGTTRVRQRLPQREDVEADRTMCPRVLVDGVACDRDKEYRDAQR